MNRNYQREDDDIKAVLQADGPALARLAAWTIAAIALLIAGLLATG